MDKKENMNVLVVGGAGYIGSVLCRKLLADGKRVSVLDNLLFGGEGIVDLIQSSQFRFIHGDIRNKKDVNSALENIDCVVNLAAIVGEHLCNADPKTARETNLIAGCDVAEMARKKKIRRFIFISTCSNYGISKNKELATEESVVNPISLYAETKVEAEKYILSLASSTFTPTVIRLSTVFGLSPRMRFDLLVNELVREAYLFKKLSVYKQNAYRPLVYVIDAAEAIIAIASAEYQKIHGEIYNIGFGNYQKKELVAMIRTELPSIAVHMQEDTGDIRDYKVSFKKAEKTLGFKARISVAEGIKEIIQALRWGVFVEPHSYRFSNIGWPKK